MEDMQVAAQEMAMHVSLCVCSEYIQSWGMIDFIQKLSEYVDDPHLEATLAMLEEMEDG